MAAGVARRALSKRGAAGWPAGEHAPTYVRRAKLAQSSSIGIVIADLVRLNLVMSLVRPTTRTYVEDSNSSDARSVRPRVTWGFRLTQSIGVSEHVRGPACRRGAQDRGPFSKLCP